jgi:glycosyltransferase involved in cell wall biosynthesis/lipopolysaccharide biosynthesis regulator YciM
MSGSYTRKKDLSRLKVAMLIRANVLSQRGGDTVLLERMTEGLRSRGHEVVWDFECKEDLSDCDIAHLFNFATPEVTENCSKYVKSFNLPFVVTTLYEDWPRFFSPMVDTFIALQKYVENGQSDWERIWNERLKVGKTPIQDNSYSAFHADALIASGSNELDSLRRDYPHSRRFEINHFGHDVFDGRPDPNLFREAYKVENFVLCVGRFEWRKNQLMLLKALEDSDIPLVFLFGGFTYQPDYEAICRRFKRRGKTHFISRVEPAMLASAFAACKVHALPSWYELPGLVSVEAAHYGANVVASTEGTIRDYLGDDAWYCSPDNFESIRKAVEEAYYAPKTDRLSKRVSRFTWDNCVDELLGIYGNVLADYGYSEESPKMSDFSDLKGLDMAMKNIALASGEVSKAKETVSLIPTKLSTIDVKLSEDLQKEVEGSCDEGDILAREGKNHEAEERYEAALKKSRQFARPYRGLAVLRLNEKKFTESEALFYRALQVDKDDIKSELGLALVLSQSGQKREALRSYEKILAANPGHLLALRQYLQLCYEVEEFSGLEQVLESYLMIDSRNIDIRFCLAGCYFKQSKYSEAARVLNEILGENPDHAPSLELKAELDKRIVSVNADPFTDRIRELESLIRSKQFDAAKLSADNLLAENDLEERRTLIEIIRAEALICLGRGDEVRKTLESHRDDEAYGYRATANLGVLWGSENNWSKAAHFFRLATALKPDHDVSLAGLGICSILSGDREAAWDYFMRAHTANPENLRALTGLIELGYPLKRLETLERALLKYLEFVPGNLSILYAHAGCAYAMGKLETAVEQLEKIKLFDPGHELANELLAKIEEDFKLQARA